MPSIGCALFLHGRYRKSDFPFYRSLCRGKYLIAVDGGYSFFRRSGIKPNLMIGDFDSLKSMPRDTSGINIMRYPKAKDATDSELALRLCVLQLRAHVIDVVQPSTGEPDQFLANILLLAIPRREHRPGINPTVRLINPSYEIRFLKDESITIRNAVGDKISVIPLSRTVSYSCEGTEFIARSQKIKIGATLATRNVIRGKSAVLWVKGTALIVRQFRKKGLKRAS